LHAAVHPRELFGAEISAIGFAHVCTATMRTATIVPDNH